MKTFFTFLALLFVSLINCQTHYSSFNKGVSNRTGDEAITFNNIREWQDIEGRVRTGGWENGEVYFEMTVGRQNMGDFKVKNWKIYKDYVILDMEVASAEVKAVYNWEENTIHLNFIEAKANLYFGYLPTQLTEEEEALAEILGG